MAMAMARGALRAIPAARFGDGDGSQQISGQAMVTLSFGRVVTAYRPGCGWHGRVETRGAHSRCTSATTTSKKDEGC